MQVFHFLKAQLLENKEEPFQSHTQTALAVCSPPQSKSRTEVRPYFYFVDVVSESWNLLSVWIFEASEAILGGRELELA